MNLNELIKKYEEELKNCIEQEEVWKKEISKTDDENYKFACREYIAEFRMQKVCCNRFLQDLEELKKAQLQNLNKVKAYLGSQKVTPEMVAIAMRKIEISILGVDTDE